MATQLGNVITQDEIHDLPIGTKLVKVGDTEVKERGDSRGNWFADGSKATGHPYGTQWVIVGLAEHKALDLTSRDDVALLIRRAIADDETLADLGWSADDYGRAADAVLSKFEPKNVRNARVGDRIKLVNHDSFRAKDVALGTEGRVDSPVDMDNELYVEFDNGRYTYVNVSQLQFA